MWQLRGRYPNRGFPKIFNDDSVGDEARRLHGEALEMLSMLKSKKRVTLKAIFGLYPANAVGDDIEVYADESRGAPAATFHTLRQQAEKDTDEPYVALSDFIAPKGSGVGDYIGAFVCSAGFGLDELTKEFKAAGDDYSYIMAEALADRLAEALAEVLHERVRKDFWVRFRGGYGVAFWAVLLSALGFLRLCCCLCVRDAEFPCRAVPVARC